MASATYDAANRLTQWGAATLAHDANGNLTSDGAATYTWNVRDQLASLTGASFQYDALGRRQQRVVSGTTTEWVYDGLTPVQEQDGTQVTANQFTGLGIDEYLARLEGSTTRYLLPDALGSTVALADEAGAVQTEYTYAPFGATTSSGQPSTNPHRFTGREMDGTGLYYYRARYYHPSLGRFISEDPIRFRGGDVNLYSYVWNNPARFVDPLGLYVANLSPNGILIKPEDGDIGILPPCSEWPGSPDGGLPLPPGWKPGDLPFRYGPWHKFRGTKDLPDNDVFIGPDGSVSCAGGPCLWIPGGHTIVPRAPDPTWVPPIRPGPIPGATPLPPDMCGPKPSKSSG